MAVKIATLEALIREQAGEIAILRIQVAGYQDDIAQLKAQQPTEKNDGG